MPDTTERLVAEIYDTIRRTAVHYGLWYANAVNRFGLDHALEMEKAAGDRAIGIVTERLAEAVGLKGGLDGVLTAMGPERLDRLRDAMAKNWLVFDGVWFQAVEEREGMAAAKQVNDACWRDFAPLEAKRILELNDLPESGGLEVLAKTFQHRLYGLISEQETVFEDDNTLVLYTRKCRVQEARKRKGLPDYPCKSAGIVEFPSFARGVDRRIRCECIACPPDDHPADWYCAWRFTIEPLPAGKVSDLLLAAIDLTGKRVLDVGCGDGSLTRLLARQGAVVTGIDTDAGQLAKARATAVVAGEAYVEGLAQALPAEDRTVDLVVFSNSLHHVPLDQQDKAMAETARVLVSGGEVFISEPLAEGPHFQLTRAINDETELRGGALAAIRAAGQWGLSGLSETLIMQSSRYDDYDGFRQRQLTVDPSRASRLTLQDDALRAAFQQYGRRDAHGWTFDQPMRVNRLRKL